MLEIRLLGRFEIHLDGRPIEIASRPAQSLLAYLLLRRGAAQRREKVAGSLWPEASESNARAYLRQALWRIRRALHDAGHDYFLADDLTVALDESAPLRLDVADLEQPVRADGPADELMPQVAAYQGELLPGFYEEWVLPERERLQSIYEHKMGLLLDRLVAARRWPEVLEWAERWIAGGAVPEPAYRALMTAHAGLGDRSSMAAVYRRCVEALRRELDVEPAETTHALYEQLSTGKVPWEDTAPTPPRAAPVPLGNLPRQLTSFIGREREMTEVQRLLTTSPGRLVTLTGPGGCGKTRLALQVGQELRPDYPQGVWLVELAPVADPALLAQAVAAALDLHEDSRRPLLTTITDYLRSRKALLILDNCEHVIGASARLAESLLQSCAELRIVASSREPLGVAGEAVFRVPSLSTPDPRQLQPVGDVARYEAVRLFVDRAAAVLPGFALTGENASAIAQICQRLDGIPLAIELAAARIQVLTVEQVAARLTDVFRLLTGGSRTALPRQQTLRAAIDWSYDLLAPAERALLCRLAVFAGGWTLEAAEAVGADWEEAAGPYETTDVLDLLTQLVNKSLVIAEHRPGKETRYRLLETIRQYAREKLCVECGGERAWDRHLDYFVTLAERANKGMAGPRQIEWLDRLEEEIDNVRTALEWALEFVVVSGLGLGGGLLVFLLVCCFFTAPAGKLRELLARPEAQSHTLARARALDTAASLAGWQGDLAGAHALAEESLALCRELGDRRGEAAALHSLGIVACLQDDYVTGRPLVLESLALHRELGDEQGQASALLDLGSLADCWDAARARGYLEEGLALYRKQEDVVGVAGALDSLGKLALRQGDLEQARRWLEESLALQRSFAGAGLAFTLSNLGELALRAEDYAQACTYFCESLSLGEAAGQWLTVYWGTAHMGFVALQQGEQEQARATFSEAQRLFQRAGSKIGVVYALEGMASLAVRQGQPERAVRLFAWADAARAAIGDMRPPVEQAGVGREIDELRAHLDPAVYAAAYAQGQAMTMEQAIAYAQGIG